MAKVKDSDLEQVYAAQVKSFVSSDAWRKFVLPMLHQVVAKELPAPTGPNWEEKYRFAFALSQSMSLLINSLTNLSGRDDFLQNIQKRLDMPVDEA